MAEASNLQRTASITSRSRLLFAVPIFILASSSLLEQKYLRNLSIILTTSPAFDAKNHSLHSSDKVPCRVAVTNSKPFHYETLESIAGKLPLHYMNLMSCSSIIFDYHILASRERYKSWVTYFKSSMRNRDVSSFNSNNKDRPRRIIGDLVLCENVERYEIIQPSPLDNDGYDAQVEASCYCQGRDAPFNNHGDRWMQQEASRTCIFHEACPQVSNHSRAVWASPHYNHYYIPTLLPKINKTTKASSTAKPTICVVGTTKKRDWNFLQDYLDSTIRDENSMQIQLQVVGHGKFPKALQNYKRIVTMSHIDDFQEFHDQVAKCGAILTLVSKARQPDYFITESSKMKLTGAMTIVLAYEIPVLLHEDLYELYKIDLPPNLTFVTHNDDFKSFRHAMSVLLDKLDYGSAS